MITLFEKNIESAWAKTYKQDGLFGYPIFFAAPPK